MLWGCERSLQELWKLEKVSVCKGFYSFDHKYQVKERDLQRWGDVSFFMQEAGILLRVVSSA